MCNFFTIYILMLNDYDFIYQLSNVYLFVLCFFYFVSGFSMCVHRDFAHGL